MNGGPSNGFYATGNTAIELVLGKSGAGRMFPDSLAQKNGPTSVVVIPVTVDQAAAVSSDLQALKQTPPDYQLYTQNCATTAGQVLRSAGIPNVPNALLPSTFISGFGH